MIKEFIAGVIALTSLAFGANSGLSVGESVTPFHPTHVTGPDKGTDTCPPCKYGARPAVQVWVNNDSHENVMKIAQLLNKNAAANENFKGFVIFVTTTPKELGGKIESVVTESGLNKIGCAVIDPKNEALTNYKINLDKDIKNTVFVYKNKKVVAKFVNLTSDDKGLGQLTAAITSVTK